jgi:hypothetical protein
MPLLWVDRRPAQASHQRALQASSRHLGVGPDTSDPPRPVAAPRQQRGLPPLSACCRADLVIVDAAAPGQPCRLPAETHAAPLLLLAPGAAGDGLMHAHAGCARRLK